MSLKSDAETIRDLADRITTFEILRLQLTANGGVIQVIPDNPDTNVTLSAAQKQALLAVEANWQAQIKAISAAW